MSRILLVASAAACICAGHAFAQDAGGGDPCFFVRDYQGFRAIDRHSFYIRARTHDFYRIETEGECPQLTEPDARLITVVHGPDRVCGPLDWQLQVATASDPPVACILKSQVRLSTQEAASIPSKLRP